MFLSRNLIRLIKPTSQLTQIRNALPGARKRKPFIDEDLTVQVIIDRHRPSTCEDWNVVKEDIISIDKRASAVNIDSLILSKCLGLGKYDYAKSYLTHLKNQGTELNLATVGKVFRLYWHLHENNLSDEIEEKILKLYEEVREKYKVFDGYTTECIIMALSITKHWELCKVLLDEFKLVSCPSSIAYSNTAYAAFRNTSSDLGFSLLYEMIENKREPLDLVYKSFIDSCETIAQIEDLLNFFSATDIVCSRNIIDHLISFNKTHGIRNEIVKMNTRGNCTHCKNSLAKAHLTQEEFNVLKKAFMERVIVGTDVFKKTTPQELTTFEHFIAKNKTYDVIIDGLNVAYSSGTKLPVNVTSSNVAAVVKYYKAQSQSILVLGRTHMKRWPNWREVCNNADLFLAQGISQDDPYLLYCALNSGMRAKIISRDLMRGHQYLLKDVNHKRLFSRWLNQCQHQLIKIFENGKVIIEPPLPYTRSAQKVSNTWHVPFNEEGESTGNRWLCVICT